MLINTKKTPNWREDSSLKCNTEYKRKFAWYRITCSDGTKVWFGHYYRKYEHWTEVWNSSISKDMHRHTDLVEYVSEAEYIVRKLAEEL
jgi:hypothetical protein